jgi:hypothetical protein
MINSSLLKVEMDITDMYKEAGRTFPPMYTSGAGPRRTGAAGSGGKMSDVANNATGEGRPESLKKYYIYTVVPLVPQNCYASNSIINVLRTRFKVVEYT